MGSNKVTEARSLRPTKSRSGFGYSVFRQPVSRVMKFEKFRQNLTNKFSNDQGAVVLDYGSGDRPYEEMLNGFFTRYIAADYPATNSTHAAVPDVLIGESSIEMDDQSVDCVVLTEVLEHVYQPKTVLSEIYRVLRPGGHLIGTVPFAIYEHEAPYDYHRYTSFCLERMFRETGFEEIRVEYVGDLVGVAAISATHLALAPVELSKRYLGQSIPAAITLVVRWPEYLYYFAKRIGIKFERSNYLRKFPVGFSFCVSRPAIESDPEAKSDVLAGTQSVTT
jgi:SAM-dependent methyltransferase